MVGDNEVPDMMSGDDIPDYMARLRLDGKVFLVLGAGRGMGRQTAHALHQAGAKIMCVDRDEARGRAIASELGSAFFTADVTRKDVVLAMFEEARSRLGRVDGVVDIIGGSTGAWIPDVQPKSMAALLDLNLTHAVLVASVGAAFIQSGGSITFVGSVAGLTSIPRQAIYGAAKAALHHFVRSTAAEFGHRGIRVNAVAPGFVSTPRMVERFSTEDWSELAAATPLQRVALPMEIAGPLLFLASDLASFITGHVLVADGGIVAPLRAMRRGSAAQLAGQFEP